jgi:hypothetical protein
VGIWEKKNLNQRSISSGYLKEKKWNQRITSSSYFRKNPQVSRKKEPTVFKAVISQFQFFLRRLRFVFFETR